MALTHDEVIDAAVLLLRTHGLADLTMRRLARELTVQPGALYWHVDNKQTLLVRVAERMLAEVTTATGSTPMAGIRRLATGVREAVLPVPDGADVVALGYALDPTAVRAFVRLRQFVGELCDSAASTAAGTDLIVHYVLGSVGVEQNSRSAGLPTHGSAGTFERGLELALIAITNTTSTTTTARRNAHGS